MFRIGEFSKLSQVTIKTLRYYDDIGLLKPAHIDPFTGYRYYSAAQFSRLNRILALKDLGLSLEQIAQLLDDTLTAEQMRGILRLKYAELQVHVQEEQARLARVEARLKQIEREGKLPEHEIVIKIVEPQRVVAIREIAPSIANIGQLFREVGEAVERNGIKMIGPCVGLYHHDGYRDHDLDMEVAVPVDDTFNRSIALAEGRHMTVSELPGVETMASLLHYGSYDTIGETYMAIGQLISAKGYVAHPPAREVYLRMPSDTHDTTEYLTEIQFPVTKG